MTTAHAPADPHAPSASAQMNVWEGEGGALVNGAARDAAGPATDAERSVAMMGAIVALFGDMPSDLRLSLFCDLQAPLLSPDP